MGAVIWNKEVMPVDTHVFRVSARIGLSVGAKTPRATELQLEKYIPSHLLPIAHHWLTLHGRYTCIARKPKCENCGITQWCKYFQTNVRRAQSEN
jgi:endonuclease-3